MSHSYQFGSSRFQAKNIVSILFSTDYIYIVLSFLCIDAMAIFKRKPDYLYSNAR